MYTMLSLKIPDDCFEAYRTFIDKWRSCKHFADVNAMEPSKVLITVAFMPIADLDFIENIFQQIDDICEGNAEVIGFDKRRI